MWIKAGRCFDTAGSAMKARRQMWSAGRQNIIYRNGGRDSNHLQGRRGKEKEDKKEKESTGEEDENGEMGVDEEIQYRGGGKPGALAPHLPPFPAAPSLAIAQLCVFAPNRVTTWTWM